MKVAASKDHVAGGEVFHLAAVEADFRAHRLGVEAGDDPRPHRLEGVGILGAPQGAVGAPPAAPANKRLTLEQYKNIMYASDG